MRQIASFRQIDGWLSDREALGLYQMAASLCEYAGIVQIGSWQGKSTYCLASGLHTGFVYAIDPFNGDAGKDKDSSQEYAEKKEEKDLSEIFLSNMKRLGVITKIQMRKGYSKQLSHLFSNINALFIDGDHSIEGCLSDYNLYADKIVAGGFLAFHDYYADKPHLGPTHVIQQQVMKDPRFSFYRQYDSLWIARRKN